MKVKSIIYRAAAAAAILVAAAAPCARAAAPDYCTGLIGAPRVEQVSDHVWVAIGYDLANVALIHTGAGNVIVDSAMTRGRARQIKEAFAKHAPAGPVAALIFTHSHIDHIGGAAEFAGPGTPVWATDAFEKHFFKQYGVFGTIESLRGARQFGRHLPEDQMPCSALGLKIDFDGTADSGVMLPTNTFSGVKKLNIGGLGIELHEAHGETHDHLFVYVPADGAIIAGDNYYESFPNLYSLRGTSPRQADEWIGSVDAMRRLRPEHIVPCHTKPVHGARVVSETLTNYRDAIQWVRDSVIRLANRGADLDTIAESVRLPAHLAALSYNKEIYGQVDFSARAVYTNSLGWFDGRPEMLYPLPAAELARREIELMGGAQKVFSTAEKALAHGDPKWAAHLLAKLERSGLADRALENKLKSKLADAFEAVAENVPNSNGRSYLLESALELRDAIPASDEQIVFGEDFVARVPLEQVFYIMSTRLAPEKSMDAHESLEFVFPDVGARYIVTVRRGVAEVVEGAPLPGTPKPMATVTADSRDYLRLAMNLDTPAAMFAAGKIKIKGNMANVMKFLGMFESGD